MRNSIAPGIIARRGLLLGTLRLAGGRGDAWRDDAGGGRERRYGDRHR